MKPTWTSDCGAVELWLGGCLDILPTLAGVDAVVTDPPYGVTDQPWDCRFKQEWLTALLAWSRGPVLAFNAARPDIQRHMLSLEPLADRVIAWRQPKVTAGHGMFWTWQPIFTWQASFNGWDTLECIAEGRYQHPTQKPVALMSKLIRMTTEQGDVIGDAFMGAGSTAIAALRMSRRFIGIEIECKYFDIAVKRIEKALVDKAAELPFAEK